MHRKTPDFIGTSSPLRQLISDITAASRSHAKVLITGESGTGKELTARAIHAGSSRRRHPFVAMNCAGMPETLLESELFGHTRGSFTGAVRDRAGLLEAAHHGTAFLDEVGEMTPRMQGLLLRFLENGEIQRVGADRNDAPLDVRTIAATNRDLAAAVAKDEFRLDLFYRLNVIHVRTPALRDRREDIPLLLDHFVRGYSERYEMPIPEISAAAMQQLLQYRWPGNVRELKNVAERLVVGAHTCVDIDDLPLEITFAVEQQPVAKLAASRVEDIVERMTRQGESFWSAVYAPFMTRDLTRDDVRAIISQGLERTRGSYTLLVSLFNLRADDYKRLLNFLRKHQCHVEFQQFRRIVEPGAAPAASLHVN